MPDNADSNGRLSLREHFDFRFDTLEREIRESRDDAKERERVRQKLVDAMLEDHETRIRCQERQSVWKWIAQAVVGLLALVGIGVGSS